MYWNWRVHTLKSALVPVFNWLFFQLLSGRSDDFGAHIATNHQVWPSGGTPLSVPPEICQNVEDCWHHTRWVLHQYMVVRAVYIPLPNGSEQVKLLIGKVNFGKVFFYSNNVDGLVQERHNSSALAMELHLSCISPSIYKLIEKCKILKFICGNPHTGKTTSLYWDGPQVFGIAWCC